VRVGEGRLDEAIWLETFPNLGVIVLELDSLGVPEVVVIGIGSEGLRAKPSAGGAAAVATLGALAALAERALPSACMSGIFRFCAEFEGPWSD